MSNYYIDQFKVHLSRLSELGISPTNIVMNKNTSDKIYGQLLKASPAYRRETIIPSVDYIWSTRVTIDNTLKDNVAIIQTHHHWMSQVINFVDDKRPSHPITMLKLASTIAERSTCKRRQVGCVLTDAHGRVLSMGHNGVAKGQEHCTDKPCPGANCPSGTGLDKCEAIHAEQNALMFCADVMKIHACYVTASPCINCVKMLMNTSCNEIHFLEKYPHPEAEKLWTNSYFERKWIHHG